MRRGVFGGEALVPRGSHCAGAARARLEIFGEGGGEERDQLAADRRVKALGGEAKLGAGIDSGGRAVARADVGEHFVKSDGRAVAVGGVIPLPAQEQKRVAVDRGADCDARERRGRQRKIKEGQVVLLLGCRADTDVGRLDVAVKDLLVLEILEGV